MTIKPKYWFVHGKDLSVGNIYESDKFGLIVIFNGILEFGEPFHIRNTAGENVEGEEKRELIEALTGVMAESVKDG